MTDPILPRLVVGLGNPGREYERTRHNVGFLVAMELARRWGVGSWQRAHRAELAEARVGERKVWLARPQTYMNNSGQSVNAMVRYYRLTPGELLVVYDELDLAFGRIRLRPDGSAGGHNGMRSLIASLGVQGFPRLRVGIGRPTRGDPMRHVLGRWTNEESESLGQVVSLAADAVELALESGIVTAMNEYNGR